MTTIGLDEYIEQKIKMLKEDFKIRLSFKDIANLKACTSEMQVDRVARDIFKNKLK